MYFEKKFIVSLLISVFFLSIYSMDSDPIKNKLIQAIEQLKINEVKTLLQHNKTKFSQEDIEEIKNSLENHSVSKLGINFEKFDNEFRFATKAAIVFAVLFKITGEGYSFMSGGISISCISSAIVNFAYSRYYKNRFNKFEAIKVLLSAH